MAAHTVGQIYAAARTKVRTMSHNVRAKLIVSEVGFTRDALCHRVAEAVPEHEYAFFVSQFTGSAAIEMANTVAVEHKGLIRRD
jgi:adenosylmethionine-8-amino-7-oxononanoate aminotransferase